MQRSTLMGAILLLVVTLASAPSTLADQSSYCPFWYLDARTDAVLEIASNADEARQVTPVLLLEGRERLALPPVSVAPGATVRIPLRDFLGDPPQDLLRSRRLAIASPRSADSRWGDGSVPGSRWGAALLEGENLATLYSWIVTEDRGRGLSINSMFAPAFRGVESLAGMWWRPTEDAQALMAVQNVSGEHALVLTSIVTGGETFTGPTLQLAPGESRLVSPEQLAEAGNGEAGAVLFTTASGERRIQGWTLLVDEATGFSTPLHMATPSLKPSTASQMPSALLGEAPGSLGLPAGLQFRPQLLLTNLAGTPVTVDVTLRAESTLMRQGDPPLDLDFQAPVAHAPVLTLGPREARVVDLLDIRNSLLFTVPDGFSAVELSHDGAPGDLFAEVLTVDESYRYTFHDPFVDTKSPPLSMTSVSFDLRESSNKVILVKNTLDTALLFEVSLSYEDAMQGSNWYQWVEVLAPHELLAVDLKALRDQQVPDTHGNVLPRNVQHGHVLVRSQGRGVIAGDFAFNPRSSAASCLDPCDCPEWPNCPLIPIIFDGDGEVGNTATAIQLFCDDDPPPPSSTLTAYYYFSGLTDLQFPGEGRRCEYTVCPNQGLVQCGFAVTVTWPKQPDGSCRKYWFIIKRSFDCTTVTSGFQDTRPSFCPSV